jgi:hypothetical protein
MTDRASAVRHGRIRPRTACVAAVVALGLLLVAPAASLAAPSPDAPPGASAPLPDPAPGAPPAPAAPKPAAPKPATPAPASTAATTQAPEPAATPAPSASTTQQAPADAAPAPAATRAPRAADPPRRRTRRHARREARSRRSEVSVPTARPPVFPSAVVPLPRVADRAPASSPDEEALRLVALVLVLVVVANLGFVALATRLRRDWTAI